jgi:hypothetical protein
MERPEITIPRRIVSVIMLMLKEQSPPPAGLKKKNRTPKRPRDPT